MKRLMQLLIPLLCLSISVPALACFPGGMDYSLTFEDVALTDGATCDINAKVFVNEKRPYFGKTVFAIHGWCATANYWKPFAEALFERRSGWRAVSRVVAIDLPGHGDSALPNGKLFGLLTDEDSVQCIIEVLERLRHEYHIYPRTIIAHSQGCL